jgi:oligosaccharide repeat unit polymerase
MGVLFWILLDPLQMREGIEEFSPDVVLQTVLYIMVFICAVLVGYSLPPYRGVHRFFWRIKEMQGGTALFWTFLIIWLISLVPLVVLSKSFTNFWWLLLAGYSPEVELGWRRGMLGDERMFFISLAGLLQLSVPFLGAYILRDERFHIWQKWIAGILMVAVLMIVFFSGARRIFAFVVLGPLFYLYISLQPHLRRKWALAFVTVPIILLWLMQAQVQFRSVGFYDFDPRIVETDPLRLHRDNNFYWLAMAVDTMPKTYPYTGDWVFLQLLIHPIPRFLWPEKPFTTGFPFISWAEEKATLSLSVVGDLYVGHGVLGIIIGGIIYGWAAKNWDQLRSFATSGNLLTLIYCLGLALLLLGIRSFWDIASNWYVLGLLVFIAYRLRSKTVWRKITGPIENEIPSGG